MAKPRKATATGKRARPSSRTARTRGRVGRPKARRQSLFDEHWQVFKDALRAKIIEAHHAQDKDLSPYDRSDSILKREVYRLVRDRRKTTAFQDLDLSILEETEYLNKTFYVDIYKNPYYWILFALKCSFTSIDGFQLSKSNVTRYAQQLIYAERHDIDPDLIIGFLLQSGTLRQVCNKATEGTLEEWHPIRRSNKAMVVA